MRGAKHTAGRVLYADKICEELLRCGTGRKSECGRMETHLLCAFGKEERNIAFPRRGVSAREQCFRNHYSPELNEAKIARARKVIQNGVYLYV